LKLVAKLNPYPKYTTTVIGAYSVPDWYESLDRLVSVGQLSMAAMVDAQYRASEAAVLDQELAGIDVVTGGEMHRRTHNRHSPPNAMLNYFWQKIPAFQGTTKPKPITPHDPNVFHPAATCRSRIFDNVDLGLADEFRVVSALTKKPVKVTMTGPHMLAKIAYDEHYNDIAAMMADRAVQPVDAYAGNVLFLETSEEMPRAEEVYRILRNMGERGLLRQFPALLMGRAKSWSFDNPLSTQEKADFRRQQREAVLRALQQYAPDTMAVFDVDLGHTDPRLVLPVGGRIRVDGPARRIIVTY